jgi:osmotically-inducible protein OsmY
VTRPNGVVHLTGTVSSAEQKKRAGDLAQKIETSHPVQNNITVRP